MNWEAIAAIGQLLGSVGVIVSLGYLAAQIRESSRLTRYQINLERYRTLWAPDAPDSLVEAWVKVGRVLRAQERTTFASELKTAYGLTDEEVIRLRRQHGYTLRVLETEFESFGATPELARSLRILMAAPDVALTWQALRENSSPEFREFVARASEARPS